MPPLSNAKYNKIVHGSVTGTRAAYGPVSLKFDSKIIAVFFTYNHSGVITNAYYVNPNCNFWSNDGTPFDNDYPLSNPVCYGYYVKYSGYATKISDFEIEIKYSSSNSAAAVCDYTAILESDPVGSEPMFLLNGTILYTDGTPTTDVEGAVQTIEPNKYKIKSNALINISGATYVNISN